MPLEVWNKLVNEAFSNQFSELPEFDYIAEIYRLHPEISIIDILKAEKQFGI